jgi:hypothetical protein
MPALLAPTQSVPRSVLGLTVSRRRFGRSGGGSRRGGELGAEGPVPRCGRRGHGPAVAVPLLGSGVRRGVRRGTVGGEDRLPVGAGQLDVPVAGADGPRRTDGLGLHAAVTVDGADRPADVGADRGGRCGGAAVLVDPRGGGPRVRPEQPHVDLLRVVDRRERRAGVVEVQDLPVVPALTSLGVRPPLAHPDPVPEAAAEQPEVGHRVAGDGHGAAERVPVLARSRGRQSAEQRQQEAAGDEQQERAADGTRTDRGPPAVRSAAGSD